MANSILTTSFNGFPCKRGKVRDVYDLGNELAIITTDRLSAFDRILPTGIPDRGRILTQMTSFWCNKLNIPNHFIHTDVSKLPSVFQEQQEQLLGRTMIVQKTKPLPVECVVRGFITGSAWQRYKEVGKICGIKLPANLQENSPFPRPIFTPTTKSDDKDEEITFEELIGIVGSSVAHDLERMSIDAYMQAASFAWKKGIIIADTKFEFGMFENEIIFIDEIITPDSSRMWSLDKYRLGSSMPSLDKQYVRDYLNGCWDKKGEPPALSDDVVGQTRDRYLEVYRRLIDGPIVGLQV